MSTFRFLTDDYMEIGDDTALDFAAAESFTLMVVVQPDDVTPTADQVLAAKKDDLSTAAGYAFYVDTTGVPTLIVGDGSASTEATGPSLTAGQSQTLAAVRDVASDELVVYTDGVAGTPVTDTTTSTLANALPLRVGATSGTAASFFNGQITAVVLWRSALTATEIAAAMGELAGAGSLLLLGVG